MSKKTWLEFVEESDTGKTKIWSVLNSEDGSYLGEVRWRGAWRQYVYTNYVQNRALGTVWNADCMDELTAFIREQMALRKVKTQ